MEMKIRFCLISALLFLAAGVLHPAIDGRHAARKTQTLTARIQRATDLRQAGSAWDQRKPLIASIKVSGQLSQAQNPADRMISALSARKLKAHSLTMAENGTLAFVNGNLGSAAQLEQVVVPSVQTTAALTFDQQRQDAVLAISWLQTFAAAIGVNKPAEEFVATRCQTDDLGKRHVRLQQMYRGVPVWANDLYVHIDAKDEVYAVNGRYAPTPVQVRSTEAGLSAANATEIVYNDLRQKNLLRTIAPETRRALRMPEPTAEKAIWIDRQGDSHLVWQVDLHANLRDWFTYFVDAWDGSVLHKLRNTAEGAVNASGVDLTGITRSFRAYQKNNTYYMLSDVNPITSAATDLPDNPAGGLWVIDLRNTDPTENSNYYHVQSYSATNWSDRSAVSSMYNLGLTYAYYKNVHGRDAIDGAASTIVTVVNVTEDGQAMDNAYWNGSAIFWGNGSNYFKPLAGSLDVMAHELTHGVTQYTANLIYQDQPGAMNEAMSDFFGVMVDRDDWLMGEDIMKPGTGSALRDVAQPDNRNVMSPLPSKMSQYLYTSEDQGGVHSNCGILNRAAYLVANQIGRDKTEKIWYRALTHYLTRQSQFIDGRKTLEQSAQDLYGDTEVNAIKQAFDAVEITDDGSTSTGGDEVNPTFGGGQWIAFVRDDRQIGLYNIASHQNYYFPNIRVKSKEYNYSQFSVTADGYFLYFVNEEGYITYLDLSALPNYYYHAFEDVYIENPGDIWNVAVTRDNTALAFTSQYENDNTIYFYFNDAFHYLTLELPTTQPGITGSTIRYPDVICWSPNLRYPKLAFDAYNLIELTGGGRRDWWSMGEVQINFATGGMQLTSLLPAQPEGISVGNVQYSSTDPDVIIYSYIIETDHYWDIKIHDFSNQNADNYFAFPGRQVQRPSFSPDDKKFVVDRFSDGKLLICDIAARTFEVLQIQDAYGYNITARYPKWFVIGGTYDTGVPAPTATQAPGGFRLMANFPNPFNSATRIVYQLDRRQKVTIEIYDLSGRLVRTLVNAEQSAGEHVAGWDGNDQSLRAMPSGVYFCRLSGENQIAVGQKMLLVR
ncbi:T9SS type A sorting domain-containing protein [bacterium]|nr:T9SS type A sorting domain-containing protein [bacterium]